MTNEFANAMQQRADRLCLALDVHDEQEILRIVHELKDLIGYFKLNSAFTLFGPSLVKAILDTGAKVFLDLKLHDIPNTLVGYGESITRLGVDIVTVHVAGGGHMLQELVRSSEQTARSLGVRRPKLIGISLLTSIDQALLNREMNIAGSVQDEVLRRGRLAADSGLDGMVCSAAELVHVKPHLPQDFFYVTPGVRPEGAGGDDHKRIVSYVDAIRAGSNLLVIGRTILAASDPRVAVQALHDNLAGEG